MASTLDLTILQFKNTIKDIYYQQGQTKESDIKGARQALITMHQKSNQLRERSIGISTGAMKDREEKLNMIYKHDEISNDKLADRVEKAGMSADASR